MSGKTILVAVALMVAPLMHRSAPVNIDGEGAARTEAPPSAKPRPARSGASSTWAARGGATWYAYRPGEAAAGPLLRQMLGKHWRGKVVRVRANGKTIRVRLTDWCACGPRHGVPTLIDLDVRSFSRLADKSTGVLPVVVQP